MTAPIQHTMDHMTQYAIEKFTCRIFANIAIGSTGAPTLTTKKNKGITSIARNSAGKYTITLGRPYQYLLSIKETLILASGAPSTGTNVEMMVRADNSNSSPGTLVVEFLNSSGTAVELASGTVLLLDMVLKYGTI